MKLFKTIAALALIIGAGPAFAGEKCQNPANVDRFLPPIQYRHTPTLPFKVWDAATLNAVFGIKAEDNRQAYGYYFQAADLIIVCDGLSGHALQVIRAHEEAHRLGWRHQAHAYGLTWVEDIPW